jgi:signal transduction histidine kinase
MTMTSPDISMPLTPRGVARAPWVGLNWRTVRERALRAPLIVKLLGANLLIALAAAGASALWGHPSLVAFVCLALVISFGLNAFLVRLALRPLEELQGVAEEISHGEGYVRVIGSPLADRRVERLGTTLNRLLDTVGADRARIHQLIRRSLGMRETERATLSRQLRDATAQQLSALTLQLAAAERTFGEAGGLSSLRTARELASEVLYDVRRLADSIYPGLLHELGLPAALAALAARVRARTTLRLTVDSAGVSAHLSPVLVTSIYHVAEEAVRNAVQHADARWIQIRLSAADSVLRLEVIDDGKGFDVASTDRERLCVGLFQARELLANAHGHLEIQSLPGGGTRVIATARLDQGDTC